MEIFVMIFGFLVGTSIGVVLLHTWIIPWIKNPPLHFPIDWNTYRQARNHLNNYTVKNALKISWRGWKK